jgi:hypothetical protein
MRWFICLTAASAVVETAGQVLYRKPGVKRSRVS